MFWFFLIYACSAPTGEYFNSVLKKKKEILKRKKNKSHAFVTAEMKA